MSGMSTTPSSNPGPAPAMIMGLPVSLQSQPQVMQRMAEVIAAREPGHVIAITNTETMYQGLRAEWLGRYIREADFSLCDGVGVVVAGWAWGHRIERFTGPYLQLAASDQGRAHGWRHFFYGGKPGVPEEMARRLGERYPGLVVCGTYSPPFRALSPEEDERIVEMINETRPDIVWVGLSLPKQERWIQEHLHRVRAPWMVGVGAAFDYHSGAVPWAPPLARRLGVEWIFRLLREPKLRAPRYWRSFVFVLESAWHGLRSLRFLPRPRSSG
jgi:N-acetylglucosaminyldiphosphoundecaprenol N-acetyl-beta-D-mannosaminyltransferase